MRSTLFYVPHEIGGIPLFGFGICLGLIVAFYCSWCIWRKLQGDSATQILSGSSMWLIAAAIVVFALPMAEARWGQDGEPIGLPIRGYGLMVLSGLVCGVGLTAWRGARIRLLDQPEREHGIDIDTIVGLGFSMMLGGVVGARLFFVIQKWDDTKDLDLSVRLVEALKLTEGGLVIYGGVIGGLVAGIWYCRRYGLNLLATADLIAPGYLIGQSLGRLGCLLHGCCFGGVCYSELPTIQFPNGSPPYASQILTGEILGLDVEKGGRTNQVQPGSLAEEIGVSDGDQVRAIRPLQIMPEKDRDPAATAPFAVELKTNQVNWTFSPDELPAWSLPVHPAQIYSAINAMLLCWLVFLLQPMVKRDGMAFLSAVSLYAFSRFLLEGVRSDESGQFGTTLTISQWISILGGLAAGIGLIVLSRLPKHRVWHWR